MEKVEALSMDFVEDFMEKLGYVIEDSMEKDEKVRDFLRTPWRSSGTLLRTSSMTPWRRMISSGFH